MKSKNILFSVDGIPGFKESVEKVLNKKFNIVNYIENDLPTKEERNLKFKILREINRFSNLAFLRNQYLNIINSHQDNLLNNLAPKFDYFIVIAGREFSKSFIRKLKEKNKNIKCILFLWDRFSDTSLRHAADEFDYIFTFDRKDSLEHDFIFRPSFHIDECLTSPPAWTDKKYSLYYVGTLRDKNRYSLLEKIYDEHLSAQQKADAFLKLYINKRNKKFLPAKHNDALLTNEKINYTDMIAGVKSAKVVLDIPFAGQQGLTLRALESIATRTKVITTNKDIVNYDFYSKNNILIIDKENIEIDSSFFHTPYQELEPDILDRYSASGFINEIFETVEK